MENYIGLAAVLAAFILSKENRRVPLFISIYYTVIIVAVNVFFNYPERASAIVTMGKIDAATWYVVITSIHTLAVISLLAFCKRTTIVKLYAGIITLSALYNTFGLFFSSLSMDWYSDIYLLHQRYAIQLDILVAWLASDNVISRKINGAFYDARKTGHEHGKPN